MNKKEAIEKIEDLYSFVMEEVDLINKRQAIDIISQIDEPKKVVVPKFVAEWIEDHKGNYSKWAEEARADFVFRSINDLFRFGDGLSPWDFTIDANLSEWTTKNAYKFITAILFGYTVEKEKLYTVEIPNPNIIGNEHTVLMKSIFNQIVMLRVNGDNWRTDKSYQLTESEIKQDFEWAWQWAEEVENEAKI